MAKILMVMPIRPGRSESWRRFVQELQGSRRGDFVAACRRWGVRPLASWIAPARPNDLAIVEVEGSEDLLDAEGRLAASDLPFDRWMRERIRELHAVDVGDGFDRYRAELVASPEPAIDDEDESSMRAVEMGW